MAEPELTRERFLILAEQAGFDPSDPPHLDEQRDLTENVHTLRQVLNHKGF